MKKGRNHLFAWGLLSLISILSLAEQPVYGQFYRTYNNRVFNWGVRMALNANAITNYEVYDGEDLLNGSYKNKTGFGLYTFFRVNLDRFFVQPEFGWSRINREVSFTIPSEATNPSLTDVSVEIQTANINALVGYNITKTGPFVFNVIAGTSFRYRFDAHNHVSGFDFHNKEGNYNSYGIVGFSTNISFIHFDVRYEISMFNTNIHFADIPNSPEALKGIFIRKDENIISFACGFMF